MHLHKCTYIVVNYDYGYYIYERKFITKFVFDANCNGNEIKELYNRLSLNYHF